LAKEDFGLQTVAAAAATIIDSSRNFRLDILDINEPLQIERPWIAALSLTKSACNMNNQQAVEK
jgi:hypothetical protein